MQLLSSLAGVAGLGTPASGSSSRRMARASFYLRLPTIRPEPSWLSHKRTVANKKTLHKGELFYWLGWLDSNQRMTIPKTVALPLGDTPILQDSPIFRMFFYIWQVFFYSFGLISIKK